MPKRKPIQVGPEEGGRMHLKSEDDVAEERQLADTPNETDAAPPAPGDANPTGEHGPKDYDRRTRTY